MESRLNASLWTAATTDSKNRALVEATRTLTDCAWKGCRTTSTQALAWPRLYVEDPDAGIGGAFIDSAVVPQRVKDATYELAFQFIKSGTTDLAAIDSLDNVESKTVDVLSTSYNVHLKKRGLSRFPRIMDRIRPLVDGSSVNVAVVRG